MSGNVSPEKGVWQASRVFAPTFPRQASSDTQYQMRVDKQSSFCESLMAAMENEMPGYYSVYSFPRGHSQDGNIPKIDCIFIDLDIEDGDYDRDDPDFDAWRRDMSELLVRARMVAKAIIDAGQEEHFRATLSGHKGLHLYLDFPTIAPQNGTFEQFKNGLESYGEQVMSWLDQTAGGINIEKWVDVDASDLARLARHPNTIHHGAKYDDKTRWCVPITITELAELTVDDYLTLTEAPRWPDEIERVPSESAGDKVVQAIRNAPKQLASDAKRSRGSTFNGAAVSNYEDNVKDIDIEDIEFLTSNYPCIAAFRDRDDAFDHGNASHLMEVNVIAKLVEMQTPKEVIHEFFEAIPGYDEAQTEERINTVIGREYNSFNCVNIAQQAPQFCFGDDCAVYRRNDDIQK